jgi:hypothetical protein
METPSVKAKLKMNLKVRSLICVRDSPVSVIRTLNASKWKGDNVHAQQNAFAAVNTFLWRCKNRYVKLTAQFSLMP